MEKHYKLKNIITFLIDDLKKQDFLVYFRKMSLLDATDTKVTFGVVSAFMKDNLEAKFYDQILQNTKKEIPTVERIEFKVDQNIDNPSSTNVVDCASFYKTNAKAKKAKKISGNDIMNISGKTAKCINDRYSLNNFIVGGDNQLAFSAAEAVCKNPGHSYNPLYIYGDVGLGKTHLLQAAGNAVMKKFKDKNVMYTTADKFITEYVTSVKKRSIERLRLKYREIDVLIIDDVQFLAKKEQTQNELYNIFNLLYDSNKQIIISGDRAPKELTELEPRLRSRFEWGITVDIGKPDFETRLAILQEKAREREFMIPQDVAEFIAANVVENVRELEGVLNQMIAEYELTGNGPTLLRISAQLKKLSFTTDLLGSGKSKERTTIKSYEDIIDAVSNHFGIEREGILGGNRRKEFMIPRQITMYLLKTKMNYTYERIGNIFSGRNHASVLYSCNKLQKIIKKDQVLLQEVNRIRDSIGL
ncbi:chromosomal replication initiator protein DnaA [Candidatus Gracilibacteria bacterium 28_42_T64]|nr:chromosomal replication initiator protein DnaA [Candidatus Gracilibacteria bacterium 28_42_T64]